MSTNITLNNVSYSIPATGEENWGSDVSSYLIATATGLLSKAGGAFTLTGEVDFGATYGLKAAYLKSRATNPASAGQVRLGNAESLAWRNAGNSADLALKANASNKLEFNSIEVADLSTAQTLTNKTIDGGANTLANIAYASLVLTGAIVNADISASAAIDYSKLNLASSIVDADISASAAIAYSKLALTGSIVNADISASAAIAYSKLALTGSLVDADISAGAAIARSKVAAGTASHVLINDGSGNLSSEAQLDKTRGGTGISSTATFPASGTVATVPSSGPVRSNGSALSTGNTNLASEVAGTLPIANGGTGQTSASSAFDALAPTSAKGDLIVRNSSSNTRLPIGTDGQVLVGDSSQSTGVKWTTLQQGAKNYITYGNFENNATTGWNKLTVGAVDSTTKVVSGSVTLSAAGITTFAATATNPLAGTYSLSFGNGSSALTVGQGIISDAYTIDREDQAKVLNFKLYFEATTGASNANWSGTSSNTLAIWIYDTANSAWIQPSGSWGMTQSSGVGICQGSFQAPSNMTSFRIAVVCINAPSGALVLSIDDITCGPSAGSAEGRAIASRYTAPNQTITNNAADAIIKFLTLGYDSTAAYSTSTGVYTCTASGKYKVIVNTKQTAASWAANDDATLTVYKNGSSYEVINYRKIEGSVTVALQMNGVTEMDCNAGDTIDVRISVSRSSGNTTLASGSVAFERLSSLSGGDTRIVAAMYQTSSGQTFSSGSTTKVSFATKLFDTHAAFATDTFTVPVSGKYRVSANFRVTPTSYGAATNQVNISLYKNGSGLSDLDLFQPGSTTTSDRFLSGSALVDCAAGDTLDLRLFQNTGANVTGGSTTQGQITFERLSGPSQIEATETVAAHYTGAPPTGTLNAGFNAVTFGTKVDDSHSGMSGSTYTVPASGRYAISASLYISGTYSLNQAAWVTINVNGTSKVARREVAGGAQSALSCSCGISSIRLLAGDQIVVKSYTDASGPSFGSGSDNNYFSIVRVGNY